MGYPLGGVPPSATLEGGARWRQVICAANDAGYSGRDGVKKWPAEGGHDGTEPSGRVSPSIGNGDSGKEQLAQQFLIFA